MYGGGSSAPRADARRNRALVLQAARSAFRERGLEVSIGEIARRAGVGAGTVHRHFPSKEALFRAATVDRIQLFTDTARDLADVQDPGEVFFRYLASVIRLTVRDKGLCEAMEAIHETAEGDFSPSTEAERDFVEALGGLLRRAQQAGAVRGDADLGDVLTLLVGCMAMERRRSGPDGPAAGAAGAPGRMTALMCDGLRAGRAVTKLSAERVIRNETRCEVCAGPVAAAGTGRPARYCGGACRQKAHRARRGRDAPGGRR